MAFDDPIIWILIAGMAVLLFGANKIPTFARSLGQARREFDKAARGELIEQGNSLNAPSGQKIDPLVEAAKREGIETDGKSKEQIASELSWKLGKQ